MFNRVTGGHVLRINRVRILALFLCFAVGYLIFLTIQQSSSGVGGQGFGNILVQCIFKSVYSQDLYSKSGAKFDKVTDVLYQTKQSGGEADHGYFAVDFPTDKEDLHNYTRYYNMLLQPYIALDINILEIGVKKGGSMKMWRELFSDSSGVYGMDIDPGVPTFIRDGRMKSLVVDSRDQLAVKVALRGLQFDIILDDGDHTGRAQEETLANMLPFLKPTGVYVIEDFQASGTSRWWEENYNSDFYQEKGLTWSRHADKTLYEDVVFVYPRNSFAPHIRQGWRAGNIR